MENKVQGQARELLTASESLMPRALEHLQASGALVLDERRRRPRYFDGRFLAARDLTREQQYFLTRQADLARAGGTGVVHGLQVSAVSTADGGAYLRIEAGHGVTISGEAVILTQPLTLPLANVPEVQRLDATFGLAHRPSPPAGARTGLYVLALRPVEFTANPIAAYPADIGEPRTVQHGDIVSATVASLIPYPDSGAMAETGMRRARAAREIFVEGSARGLPVDALPLAMVLLDHGGVRWVDMFLVRREVGSAHGDVLGFGFAPRALREAFLLQYEQHLADVLLDRDRGRGRHFAASEHFLALPPAGRLPAGAINPRTFTQAFFPPEVDVELSIVPEDELPALVEEAILLPPIDLEMRGAFESTSVMVLLPVERQEVRSVLAELARAAPLRPVPPQAPAGDGLTPLLSAPVELERRVRSAAPGMLAQWRPYEALQAIRLPRVPQPLPALVNLVDAAWARVLSNATRRGGGLLWFVRRRNLHYRASVAGAEARLFADERVAEERLDAAMGEFGLRNDLAELRAHASAAAEAEIVDFLSSVKFTGSRLLAMGALHELQMAAPVGTPEGNGHRRLSRAAVLQVAARFTEPGFGDGIIRLDVELKRAAEAAPPDDATPPADRYDKALAAIVAANAVPELDRVTRRAAYDRESVAALAGELIAAGRAADPKAAVGQVVKRYEELVS